MENNLDQLFRNKLSGHQVTPSGDSWEKLHSQLSHARGARMQKRLAIAASVIFFMSVIGVAYYYLDTQNSVENPMVSEKVDTTTSNSEIAETIPEPLISLKESKNVNDNELDISKEQRVQITDAGQKKNYPKSIQSNTELSEVNTSIPAETNDDFPLLAEVTNENLLETTSMVAESQAETTAESTLIEIQPPSEPLTVTITYKANKNSKLVTSQKTNVIQEGIEKITGFAEERVFTDELKTKLRNTTGDVLALNFGKLINKPNKEN